MYAYALVQKTNKQCEKRRISFNSDVCMNRRIDNYLP